MSQYADTLVLGDAWTGDPDRPRAQGVAIVDGSIAMVGDRAELDGTIGPKTRVVRAAGSILPAFHDAHTHLIEGAMFDVACNLHDLELAATFERIRAYASRLGRDEWVRGGGWSMDEFAREGVDRRQLDGLVAGRPAYLTARDGHSAWVSSRALELSAVDRTTPDPAGGKIERDADGEPTGILHETAMGLVTAVLPPTSDDEWIAAFELGQRYLHSLGITSWQDARIEPRLLEAYLDAERRGLLHSRVALALAWDRSRGSEQIDDLVALRARLDNSSITAPTVKVFVDGVLENHTASMIRPYDDLGGHGAPLYEDASLREIVRLCTQHGFGVHFHAVGDGAVRSALDACVGLGPDAERVRHQICHLQSIHPDDIARFAQLGVIANIQPYWASNDSQMLDLCLPALGEARYEGQYPFRSLQKAGARLACGSDWRVSTPNPFPQIQVAVTRRPVGQAQVPALAQEEALDVESVVRGFTSGAAYASGLEHVSGQLRRGMSADLVMLDSDLWQVSPERLSACTVTGTMFAGRWVFGGPDAAETTDLGPV